jgi:hypothetical protein
MPVVKVAGTARVRVCDRAASRGQTMVAMQAWLAGQPGGQGNVP